MPTRRRSRRLVAQGARRGRAIELTTLHLHNTRGLGLANALAGLEEGITTLDASLGGLGRLSVRARRLGQHRHRGPGLHARRRWAIDTGIDLDALLRVRAIVAEALPGEPLYGFTPDAGLPLDY